MTLGRYGGGYLIEDFIKGRTSVSSASDFNDPFELHFKPGRLPNAEEQAQMVEFALTQGLPAWEKILETHGLSEGQKESARQHLRSVLPGMLPSASEQIEQFRDLIFRVSDEEHKIMCCANTGGSPHDGEISMWSYYAENHRGVRMHFSDAFHKPYAVIPMTYVSVPVHFGYDEFLSGGMEKMMSRIVAQKSIAWSHEREIRLLILNNFTSLSPDSRNFPRFWIPLQRSDVTRIDLGIRFPNPTIAVKALTDYAPDIEIYQTRRDPESFLCSYDRIG